MTGWCWHFIQIAQVGHFWKLFIVQPLEVPLTYFFLTVLWKYSCSFQKFLIYFQIGYHILERYDSAWNIYSKNYFILISVLKNVFVQKISSLLPALFLLQLFYSASHLEHREFYEELWYTRNSYLAVKVITSISEAKPKFHRGGPLISLFPSFPLRKLF